MAAIVSLRIMLLLVHVELVFCQLPKVLTLHRAIPGTHDLQLSQLRARDRIRHGRLLQSASGVVDFPVAGTFDPFVVGFYYAKVQLGSPAREFNVQIDTASDVLWVSCSSCNGCPRSSGLQIQLNFFDPRSSSTASLISCTDQKCRLGFQSTESNCSAQNNQCNYTFKYADGSGTSGYYVSDFLHLNTIVQGSLTTNSSASILFGCSTTHTGDLTKSDRAIDGIFGFGQQNMSVISQLSSQGLTPKVFAHCLKGDSFGGGKLVLGEVLEPNIVYSPLVQLRPHYNLYLQSISVNGQPLSIDPSVSATLSNRGTIIDTGTTLAYLNEDAYDPLINALTSSVLQPVHPILPKENQCFVVTSSIAGLFPTVSFNFAGGASLVLNPQDYLVQQKSVGGAAVWCIGFQKTQGQTILGDLVLKDKIFVYDLAGQRIGWTNYNCSMSFNFSTTTNASRSEFAKAGHLSSNASLIPIMNMIAFLLHILVLGSFLFL